MEVTCGGVLRTTSTWADPSLEPAVVILTSLVSDGGGLSAVAPSHPRSAASSGAKNTIGREVNRYIMIEFLLLYGPAPFKRLQMELRPDRDEKDFGHAFR